MKLIPLTRGQVAKVCDCHARLVENYKWSAVWNKDMQSYYASRGTSIAERLLGAPRTMSMHKVINNTPKGMHTDHKNHDTLDNQCSNLRNATPSQNHSNQNKSKSNTSGYKGVSRRKNSSKWTAFITVNNERKHLGTFDTAEEAARWYDDAAIEHYGEFANTNFPIEH